jgi:hypothetical protein
MNAGVQAYGTTDAIAFFLRRCMAFKPDVVTLGFFLNDAMDNAETIRQNEAMTEAYQPSILGRASAIFSMIERSRQARRLQREYFDAIRASFRSPQWSRCKEILKGMQTEVAQKEGFRFIVVVFPVLWELDGDYPFEDIHAMIAKGCREAGCEVIDLLDVYRGHSAASLWVHPTDHHPNEIAHRLAAERTVEYLLSTRDKQPQSAGHDRPAMSNH